MEVVGLDGRHRPHKMVVTAQEMAVLGGTVTLDASLAGAKLAKCVGTPLGPLMDALHWGSGQGFKLGPSVSGRLTATDGVTTHPIAYPELVQGVIVHTAPSGDALPQSLGGHFRVAFPAGVAVQDSVCGTPKPVNLKGVCRLELSAAAPEPEQPPWKGPVGRGWVVAAAALAGVLVVSTARRRLNS